MNLKESVKNKKQNKKQKTSSTDPIPHFPIDYG